MAILFLNDDTSVGNKRWIDYSETSVAARRRRSLMLCKSCQYPLKQLSERRCPECGRAFDPADPSTFDISQPINRRFWWIMVGSTYLAMFLLAFVSLLMTPSGQVINNVPNVQVTLVPEPLPSIILRAAVMALFNCPFAFVLVFIAYTFVTWAIPYLIPRGLKVRRP